MNTEISIVMKIMSGYTRTRLAITISVSLLMPFISVIDLCPRIASSIIL